MGETTNKLAAANAARAKAAEIRKKVKTLKEAGIDITGSETEAELNELLAQLEADKKETATASAHVDATSGDAKPNYNLYDRRKIKEIKDLGGIINGTETSDELDTALSAARQDASEEEPATVRKPMQHNGQEVPDKLPIRKQRIHVLKRDIDVGICFTAAVAGGAMALYNENGIRIDFAADGDGMKQLGRKCAHYNSHLVHVATQEASRVKVSS